MVFKFVFAFALVAVASAGYPSSYTYHSGPLALNAAPVAVAHKVVVKSEEYDHHPQYKYSYGVEDKLTGDSKNQVEERDGGIVRGEYSLIDADGYKRTVKYTADDRNGFNAIVEREPLVKKVTHYSAPAIVKTVAPIVHYSAPTVVKTVAPVAHYSSPTLLNDHYTSPVKYTSYDVPTYYNYHQH